MDPDGRFPTAVFISIGVGAGVAINKAWDSMETFHFEEREAFASNTPTYEDIDKIDGWTLLSADKSIFHDNGVGEPELKYVHEDGREVVFTKDNVPGGSTDGTYQEYTDPKYKGTYNYAPPGDWENAETFEEKMKAFEADVEHGIKDVAPYIITGKNEREQTPFWIEKIQDWIKGE